MEILDSVLKLSAGIGMFLFAMHLIEESLKNLSGRHFKIFLQRMTKNRLAAASGGAIVTSVVQSSSLVSLIVLAFVGAGVFTLKDAMAIILGANLGTTIDSWLVATLGFKTNIEMVAYPALCISGLLLIIFGKRKRVSYLAYFLFGFGLLFIGLSFMRIAMETQVSNFNFKQYAGYPSWIFLIIGFLITLLVQSSSVTMALTLTAIHVQAIDLPTAAAIVLGSETGTTIKIVVSAIGGNASKKRVALGNLLFNIFLTIGAFVFLNPILNIITNVFLTTNPLLQLVTFSSIINLIAILIFLPLLNHFSDFLLRFFKETGDYAAAFIPSANAAEPETALYLFECDAEFFIYNTRIFNLSLFAIDLNSQMKDDVFNELNRKRSFLTKTEEEKYLFLKQMQGELQAFYLKLSAKSGDRNILHLNRLSSAVRNAMNSAKGLNDIRSNLANLSRSSKDIKFNYFTQQKAETEKYYSAINALIQRKGIAKYSELSDLLGRLESTYNTALKDFYHGARTLPIASLDFTTVINFNHALYTANKSLLMAVKDILLEAEEADNFNTIPVFMS